MKNFKTYAVKSSAARAAKKTDSNYDPKGLCQTEDGKWIYLEAIDLEIAERTGGRFVHCPSCGVHLENGMWTFEEAMAERDDKGTDAFKKEMFSHEFWCMGCDHEFGEEREIPAPEKKAAPKTTRGPNAVKSAVANPCKQVWDIAENMKGSKRKEILQACVDAGIAFNTARTQYQRYFAAVKAADQSK